MKPLIIALLFLLPVASHANLVKYSYDSPISRGIVLDDGTIIDESFDAAGVLTVDTDKRRLVSFDFVSEPVTFNWAGEAALLREPTIGPQSNGFEYVAVPDQNAWFDLWLDVFTLDQDQDIFDNLDLTHPNEGSFVGTDTDYYSLSGRFTKLRTVSVPEPATLSLLALGLAAIGIRRRLR